MYCNKILLPLFATLVAFSSYGVPANAAAIVVFQEDFNGYAGTFSGFPNDLGGHRTIFGVPTTAAGADSPLWLAARLEAATGSIGRDVGVLEFGSFSNSSPYHNPAGRVDDDAGLVAKIDLTGLTDVELAFDWRTFATESTDRFVVAYYQEDDDLGSPNGVFDWFNDPSLGNGDMSADGGTANPWYQANWTEVLRDTSPNAFQQESGISLPGGAVTYLAFWLDNGNHDLAKFDNIVVTAEVAPDPNDIPEPGSLVLLLGLLGVGRVLQVRCKGA